MPPTEQPFSAMEATLKKTVAALRDADVPFLVAGSLASWARGGPETTHDLDFIVKPEDAERALEALEAAGMRPERPPEDWLVKAWDGDVLVDLIFGPSGIEVTEEVIARGEEVEVLSMGMRVLSLEDLLVTKLASLDEHRADYSGCLLIARSIREQIDWDALRQRTRDLPFGRAFFVLLEDLGIVGGEPPSRARSHVRVVEPVSGTEARGTG